MPSVGNTKPGAMYWRSLDDLADTPEFREFVENEFPNFAPELLRSSSRRQFLKLMGASMAMAGLTGCRWPKETIAPYARRPEHRIPGVPVQYATAMDLGGHAQGLLVTAYDGRPIKVEGNPSHPNNAGATDAFAQAGVLGVWDPDRSRAIVERVGGKPVNRDWTAFTDALNAKLAPLRSQGGQGLCVLSEASSSPSLARLRERLAEACPGMQWFEYEPVSRDAERLGTWMALGRPYRTHLMLDNAVVIVSFDEDLLGSHPASVRHAREFVTGRCIRRDGKRTDTLEPMNRLYVAESDYSITGGMADHRLAVHPTLVPKLVARLAAMLAERGVKLPDEVRQLAASIPDDLSHQTAVLEAMAEDLQANPGRGAIAVGPRQPAEVHALVALLNDALGNTNKTVWYLPEPDADRLSHDAAIAKLSSAMADGQVDTLVILGGNPVFDAPADLEFDRRLGLVAMTIHLGEYENETAVACTWHVPRAHYLESWGDARSHDLTFSIVQPIIEPLYGGRTPLELVAVLAGEKTVKPYDIVRETFKGVSERAGKGFENLWAESLCNGAVIDQKRPPLNQKPVTGEWVAGLSALMSWPTAPIEVVFRPDASVYDGRFANNGWLQEMPDPLTKLTWDNAALMSPATARGLNVRSGDMVKIDCNGRSLEMAAFVLPGHAPDTVTLPLGYGRTVVGRVGESTGFNTYALRATRGMHMATGVTVTRTGRTYPLATTQDHHAMESRVGDAEKAARVPNRILREATLAEYVHRPEFAKHPPGHHPLPLVSLWEEHTFPDKPRWAVSIDLNACIGCSACVVACQAENNIPVVGKDEVSRGREMHWIRVDRYFKGAVDAPAVAHQPVACQQCENAPCEQVCPVAATVHSQEGLNDMVYNRCIGTRYCSNNCPYKVRRFNWFNNYKDREDIEKLGLNPEVTARSRGVMEKCTFCVQRISAVKIAARNEGRPIADGEITPACGQACPSRAIVFGDLNDPKSRVAKAHAADRAYVLLDELNIKPRTKYSARIRNPRSGLDASPPAAPAGDGDHGQAHG